MVRKYLSVLIAGFLLGTVWLTPAIADIINATTVNGIHASRTATAGYLYPLDSAKKFPNKVLHTGHGGGLNADAVDGIHASNIVTRTSPVWKPQTRHLAVGPSAWVTAHQGGYVDRSDDVEDRDYFAYSIGGKPLVAPVNLPDGAKVTKITLYYKDNNNASDLTVGFFRRDFATNVWHFVSPGIISSSGSAGRGSTSLTASPAETVNNAANAYYLYSSDTAVDKHIEFVVIEYTITAP